MLGEGPQPTVELPARFRDLPMLLETPKPSAAADRVNLEILSASHGR